MKLKPCPFCGSDPTIQVVEPHEHHFVDMPDFAGGAFIECAGCTGAMSGDTEEEVVAAWNKRVGEE